MIDATLAALPLPVARKERLIEVAEALMAYGLQTAPGQALWRGFLLGAGLPKGEGAICVREAVYTPTPTPTPTPEPG